MVILPNPCSTNLQPKNSPFSIPVLASIGTGKHLSHLAIIQTKSLDPFIINPVLQQSRQGQFSTYQILIKRDLDEGKSGYSGKLKTKQKDDEALEKEVETIGRLKAIVERVRELEIHKFKGNTISDEDRLLIENTSREIVDRFLLRPLQYLKSSNGDMQEKLKDLNLLIRMLEKSSCLHCQVKRARLSQNPTRDPAL
ncbi:hypothetical protein PTKIN_Ptkin12aG0123000 [Pterospermum kingtungense]